METLSVLLALSEGNTSITDGFPSQLLVTWSFNLFLLAGANCSINSLVTSAFEGIKILSFYFHNELFFSHKKAHTAEHMENWSKSSTLYLEDTEYKAIDITVM